MNNYVSRYEPNHHKFLHHTRIMAGIARALETRDYVRAQQVRTRMMNHLQQLFDKVDLILTPTSALVAPEIPDKAHVYGMCHTKMTVRSMTFCTLANLTGVPAVNVPAGFTSEKGMPIGLQFMASWWNEALLCRIAKTCERLPGIERKRPEIFANDLLF
jgi:Asp-tRNA(Asn)/Glu-tRNA(Gln) amidotransferase A subunit family amidase